MFNYILVVSAALLFSLQFLFNKRYQQIYGVGVESTLLLSTCSSLAVVLIMLIISRFNIVFSVFSVVMALIYSVSGLVLSYYGLKALKVANLSVYSVFCMLGGMLLPFGAGIIIYNEELSIFKVLCCILIVVSVMLNSKSGKHEKKAVLYYMIVFVLNGMAGVLSKIHQSAKILHTDSAGFMFMANMWNLIICTAVLLIKYKKLPAISGKGMLYASGSGALNGIANFWLLISLVNLPASVQYPLVTGGTMIFATIISMVRKEKLTLMNYVAALISFAASVMMAL